MSPCHAVGEAVTIRVSTVLKFVKHKPRYDLIPEIQQDNLNIISERPRSRAQWRIVICERVRLGPTVNQVFVAGSHGVTGGPVIAAVCRSSRWPPVTFSPKSRPPKPQFSCRRKAADIFQGGLGSKMRNIDRWVGGSHGARKVKSFRNQYAPLRRLVALTDSI